MKSRSNEPIEHHECPIDVAERLKSAGGVNPFGGPMFRVIWGYDRIVPIHGLWQEFEQFKVALTAIPAEVPVSDGEPVVYVNKELVDAGVTLGTTHERVVTRLVREVIETRHLPKYLPGNCWHLEMWRHPEEYGSPEQWGKAGEEVVGTMTIDTAGPYPERGEYELCYSLTTDGTSHGDRLPLIPEVVTEMVRMIVVGRERFNYLQRRAAIEQEERRKEEGFVRVAQDMLKDQLRPYAGEANIVVP